MFSIFSNSKEKIRDKNIDKIVSELTEIQNDIVKFTSDSTIDLEISEIVGRLKGKNPEMLSGQELVEFLVYLSDKTKTKSDMTRIHFTDTMLRVIHAKIEVLTMYRKGMATCNSIRQLFSFRTIFTILVFVIILLLALVATHKEDPSLFKDIGLSSKIKKGL